MSDKNEERENRFAKAIAEISHSQLGYWIGISLFVFANSVALKWDGHLFDRKDCVKIQKIDNFIYKVDTCSGKTELLKDKTTDENSSNKSLDDE